MSANLCKDALVNGATLNTKSSIGEGDRAKTDFHHNANCKNAGYDATHFLKRRADCVTKLLDNLARLQTSGVHLVNLPVGSVASEFHLYLCR